MQSRVRETTVMKASIHRISRLIVGVSLAFCSCAPVAQGQISLDRWFVRNSGVASDLAMVNYGSNGFVAVGLQGTILTSSNGVHWTRRTSPTSGDIYSVAFGGGRWVAVGPSALVMSSSNGVNWTVRSVPVTAGLFNVVYGNGRFVAVGSVPGVPNSDILTSTDGISWTATSVANVLSGITYANNQFVTVGGYSLCNFFFCEVYPTIYTSANGNAPWTDRFPPGEGFSLVDTTYGTNIFVTVGTAGAILTSPAGSGWTRRSSPVTTDLNSVAFGHGTFVSVGYSGTILSSTNGINWARRTSPVSRLLYEVTFGDGTFVTVGEAGTILQSERVPMTLRIAPDGSGSARISWTPADLAGFILQYSESLAPTNWVNAPSGSENPATVTTAERRFYRLVRP